MPTPENHFDQSSAKDCPAVRETRERELSRLRPIDWFVAILVVVYVADAAMNHERLDPWLTSHQIHGVAPKILILIGPLVVGAVIYWFKRWWRPKR